MSYGLQRIKQTLQTLLDKDQDALVPVKEMLACIETEIGLQAQRVPQPAMGWGHSGPCQPNCTCDVAAYTKQETQDDRKS